MNLVNRNKKSLFKKRHYVTIIKDTAKYLTRYFGYKKKPFLFESTNDDGDLMLIMRGRRKNVYGIFYDYMQFKDRFGHLDFEGQEACAMSLIAHEMRHYFQMRQLDSKKPYVPKERLDKWRENDENPKYPGDDCSVFEFYMQPMELDAELFAYVFVADVLSVRLNPKYIGKDYIKEMEKYYIELFGETDEDIFPKDSTNGCATG